MIGDMDVTNFDEGVAAGARLRQLLGAESLSDPAVATEREQLSGSLRAVMAKGLATAHVALRNARNEPAVRKSLEAMGLTREEMRRLTNALLALYDDTPGSGA